MHLVCGSHSCILRNGQRGCKFESAETQGAVQAFKGMKGVLMSTVFSYHDAKGSNPLWPGILYKGVLMRPFLQIDLHLLSALQRY